MKKTVKLLPTAAAAAVAASAAACVMAPRTNINVDAFPILPTGSSKSGATVVAGGGASASATPTAGRLMMMMTTTTSMAAINGHSSSCTCHVCTSAGSIKLSHSSNCSCPACVTGTGIGESTMLQRRSSSVGTKPQQNKQRKHESFCDCYSCRQQQRHGHGPGCHCSECIQ